MLGEHFVVHGAQALAVPLKTITTQVSIVDSVVDQGSALELSDDIKEDRTQSLFQCAVERLRCHYLSGKVEIRSSIPIGFGLGSSAALSVALLGALARAAHIELSVETLNEHAYALETLVHGSPSGIDNTVVTFQRSIRFRKEAGYEQLSPAHAFRLILASSGQPRSTMAAVQAVARRKSENPSWFDRCVRDADDLVERGISAFGCGDWKRLGAVLTANQKLLRDIGVSTRRIDTLVEVACAAGAYGAKLTGSGCGGFIIALVPSDAEEDVVAALRRAGSPQVFDSGEIV